MLRHARSLPTLKVLDSVISKEVIHAKPFSTVVSTRYNLVVPDIPHNEQRPFTEFRRNVHQTSKKNSLLATSKNSEFSIMSLNTLKMECRKRGLKVSGRKTELVSRIQTYENSFSNSSQGNSMSTSSKVRQTVEIKKIVDPVVVTKKLFSQSMKVDKKGDDSHIDYIKPIDPIDPKLVEDDYIVQIPSISTKASQTPVTELEKKLFNEKNPNKTIVSVAEGSDSKIAEAASLQLEEGTEVVEEEEPYEYDNSEIPNQDKKIWAGVLGVTGLWWLFKPKDRKK